MKEVFILTTSRFGEPMVMTPDTAEDALLRIVRKLNSVREEERINIYVSFEDMDKRYVKDLFTKIVEFLDKTSINNLNINFVVDKGYIDIQDETVEFIKNMITKYSEIESTDVILNIVVTGEEIQKEQLNLVNLIKNIDGKYIKIWAHIDAKNIIDIDHIMYQLLFNGLLDRSIITFDVDIYGSLTEEVRDAIKAIPAAALEKLIDMYLAETSEWDSHFCKECFNPDGTELDECPDYKSCILVRKNHSKLNMIKVLHKIVYALPVTKEINKAHKITEKYKARRDAIRCSKHLLNING